MDSNSLKAQFDLLQAQQRKKLQRRNELKDPGNKTCNSELNDGVPSENLKKSVQIRDSLWESEEIEDLELKLDDGHSRENGSDEDGAPLNGQLTRLREVTDENGRLYKLLKEREEELKIMKRRWKEEKKELTGQNVGSDGAAKKIIDLSKRNRELSMEVEKEKTKFSQIEKKLKDLEFRVESSNTLNMNTEKQEQLKFPDDQQSGSDMKTLQDKLSMSNNKVGELRVQVDNLKEELKVAHKVLAKEVGEGVSIQSLLGGSSNWKGRQQQIIQLQNRISELQARVNNSHDSPSLYSSSVSVLSMGSMPSSIRDDKYHSLLKRMELERKEVMEKQQTDLENLEKEFKKMKEKFDAAKVRNTILSTELKGIKGQLTTLKDKGKHDDELISALLNEQSKFKEQIAKLKKKEEESRGSVVYQPQQEHKLIAKLQEQVKNQEAKVCELEAEIQDLHNSSTRGGRQGKTSASSKKRQQQASENSDSRMSMGRNTKNETRIDVLERELQEYRQKLQEVKSFKQVTEVERDKFLELIQLLEKKIDETTQDHLKTKEDLISSKRKNAKLEKQVERLQSISSKGAAGFAGNVRPRGSTKTTNVNQTESKKTPEDFISQIDELETRLGIQIDTNDALKEALDSTLQAKESDMKFYQDMLEQTKKIFLNGLKEFKQNMVNVSVNM